jgi:4-guanidinobutyraldehyde dehydrogenase/NAD-dependent aldehyde dehydrogenase
MNDSRLPGDAASWHERSRALRPNGLALINGALMPARSGATFDCVSPIDGRTLAAVAACDTADVDAAVAAARAAFERRDWADRPPAERKRVLLRFAELVEQATPELALLETLDVGKPIQIGRAHV